MWLFDFSEVFFLINKQYFTVTNQDENSFITEAQTNFSSY